MTIRWTAVRLEFRDGLRTGGTAGDVNRQAPAVSASTLWGGLGHCAARLFGSDRTTEFVRTSRLSSMLWARGETLYVPAPSIPLTGKDPATLKGVKKWKWLPVENLEGFLRDLTLPEGEPFVPFVQEVTVSAALDRKTKAAVPYLRRRIRPLPHVEGLLIIGTPEKLTEMACAAIRLLGDTGIGGERSSGWGLFRPRFTHISETALGKLLSTEGDRYVTLGAYLPDESERPGIAGMKNPAGYELWNLRGFVGTGDIIKPTVTCLAHGATLDFRPQGSVIDITPRGAEDPVLFNGMPPSLGITI